MQGLPRLRRIDRAISEFMWRWGHRVLRFAVAVIFIWFGALKVLDMSPAKEMVTRTVYWIDPATFYPLLGGWEMAIGICLLFRPLLRAALLLLFAQMAGTFLPLVMLPEVCWIRAPWAPTLEGQYIIKNLVILGAAVVIGGTVRQQSTRSKLL